MVLPLVGDRPNANGIAWTARSATRCGRARRATCRCRIGGARAGGRVLRSVRPQHARPGHPGLRARSFFVDVLDHALPHSSRVLSSPGTSGARWRLDRGVARRRGGSPVGLGAAFRQRPQRQRVPVLADAEVLRSSRASTTFDFGRSHAQRGDVPFQEAMGRRRRASWCGNTGRAPGSAVPNLETQEPEVRPGHRAWQRLPVPVASAHRAAHRPQHSVGNAHALHRSARLVLAYVLVGYPLLLRLIVARAGATASPPGGHHAASSASSISAYNEAEVIREQDRECAVAWTTRPTHARSS